MDFKVGTIAKRTGLSVRTLHHYEDVGLLRPSGRTDAGHRLYSESDLERLLRIQVLKQLGLSLEAIGCALDDASSDALSVVRRRLAQLTEEVEAGRRLQRRLERVVAALSESGTVEVETVIECLEAMTMFDEYFSKDQLEQLEARRAAVGEDAIREAEEAWPKLIAAVQTAMDQGKDPKSEEVQVLARKWKELVTAFSGGDAAIEQSTAKMYAAQPEVRQQHGLSMELFEYIGKAWREGETDG